MRFGIFIKCPQIEVIEICGIAKLDFVVLDMEHTPLGFNDLKPLLFAAEKHSLEIILRLPANKEEYFKWPLDIGFQHIQVPQIETEKDEYKLEKYLIDLDEARYGLANMQLVARDRMREIKLWSTLKKEFDDGSFDTKDVNRHQLDSYHLIMKNKV